jgi:hypothetical protein
MPTIEPTCDRAGKGDGRFSYTGPGAVRKAHARPRKRANVGDARLGSRLAEAPGVCPHDDRDPIFTLDAPESDVSLLRYDGDPDAHACGSTFARHLRRGRTLLSAGDAAAAARVLEKALRIAPDASEARHFLALACFASGDAESALAHYEEVVSALPASATARTNLAVILLRLGRTSAARTVLTNVLDAEPGHRPAWAYLGVALEQLGLVGEAEEAFLAGDVARVPARLRARRPPAEESGSSMPTSPDVAVARSPRPSSRVTRGGRGRTRAPGTWASEGGATAGILGAVCARFLATMRAPGTAGDAGFDATPVVTPDTPPPARREAMYTATPDTARARLLVVTLAEEGREAGFAARTDAICATLGALRRCPLRGGHRSGIAALRRPGAPLFERMAGRGRVVLAPPGAARLLRIAVGAEGAFVRADLIVGLDLSLGCSAAPARQAVRDAPPMVRLRGEGAVVLALPAGFAMLDIDGDERLMLRLPSLIGWVGALRVTSRASGARRDAGAREGVGETALRLRGAGVVIVGR